MKNSKRKRVSSTQRRRMKGGKVIGQGQYGFIVSPAIPCKGINTTRKVSKVFKPKNQITPSKHKYYMNFKNIRTSLEPVLERLNEIDPDQNLFLYPTFCEEPGELSDELLKNGVTETTKYSSYLLNYGGRSYSDIFDDFFQLFKACEMYNDTKIILQFLESKGDFESNSFSYLNTPTNAEYRKVYKLIKQQINTSINTNREKLYTGLKPILMKVETSIEKLTDAGIFHGDLHDGNVIVVSDSPAFDAWVAQKEEVVKSIQESNQYKEWKTIVANARDTLTKEHKEQIQTLIDSFATIDTTSIRPLIIDWDSASLMNKEDIQTEMPFGDFISFLVPYDYFYIRYFKET